MPKLFFLLLMFSQLTIAAKLDKSYLPDPNYIPYTTENGLSNDIVMAITQDSYGYMWFGTEDGLNRFDGQDFTVYRYDSSDSNSLAGLQVQSLKVDSTGNLWIGTETGGLSLYDRKNDRFINFSVEEGLTNYNIQEIEEIDGVLWLSTDVGINLIDIHTKEVSQINFSTNDAFKTNHKWIREIINDGNDIWVATWGGGLNKYNKTTKTFVYYKHNPDDETSLSSNIIYKVHKDLQGNIWAGSLESGLNRYIESCDCFKRYSNSKSSPSLIPSNFITGFVEDSHKNLWLLTSQGAAKYNHLKDSFANYRLLKDNELKNVSRQVISGFLSDDNVLWLGSHSLGIISIPENGFNFTTYPFAPNTTNFLQSGNVFSLFFNTKDELWTGTNKAIYRYSFGSNGILGQAELILNTLANKIIKTKDQTYWVASPEGLYHLSADRKVLAFYDHKQLMPHTLTQGLVNDVLESQSGDIYIANWRGGLTRFNPLSKTFEFIDLEPVKNKELQPHDLNALHEDLQGNIWVGHRKGVYKYSPKKNNVTYYSLLENINEPPVAAYYIHGSTSGLFVASDRGLYQYQPKMNKFTLLPLNIKSNYVQSINEDDQHNLWLTTFNGLYKWNTITKEFFSFNKLDGLQGNNFNAKSTNKHQDGRILFAGKLGITYFDPDTFNNTVNISSLKWSSLLLEGNSNKIKVDLFSDPVLNIEDNINIITINYFTDDYESPVQHEYRYRLNRGNWQANNNLRVIKFFNLTKGEYQLELQYKKPNSIWHDADSTLNFTVLPPFWLTNTAYILYASLIFLILFSGYKIRIKRIKLHQKELETKIIERTTEVSNLLIQKENLFANISHELRTPLTLISSPLEQLIDDKSLTIKQSKLLKLADNNSKRLFHLVERILNLTSIEQKNKNTENIAINDQLIKYISAFEPLLEAKNIHLSKDITSRAIINADKDDLASIIENLLTNALKYTLDNGWVKLTSSINNQQYQLVVENSHQGLTEIETQKVFERFERLGQSDSEQGFGLGLAFVKELCQQNNWKIECKSSQNGKNTGSSVSFILTINNYSQLEEDATPSQRQINQLTLNSKEKITATNKQSILIVEDNTELREFLADIFSSEYSVTTAENGLLGVTNAINEIPDIIISDLMMPELNGYQLVEQLSQHDNTCHIPIILLTAKADKESELKGLELGSIDYITKPFDAKELQLKVKNMLTRKLALLSEIRNTTKNTDKHNVQYTTERDKNFIEKLNLIVEQNYIESDFSVEQLVDRIAMSERQLQRKLKAVFNQKPAEFIRYYRLQKSKELLLAGKSISNVADLVGFNSSSYFSRSFKATFEQSPSEFIQEKVTA